MQASCKRRFLQFVDSLPRNAFCFHGSRLWPCFTRALHTLCGQVLLLYIHGSWRLSRRYSCRKFEFRNGTSDNFGIGGTGARRPVDCRCVWVMYHSRLRDMGTR
eukprot:5512432-Prymnesium_polylepis.1